MNDHTQFDRREWLETNGLGGFASGTVSGIRTRRYHSLLLAATAPPTGRFVLVNGMEAWVEVDGERFEISAQYYQPDEIHPVGHQRIEKFDQRPWPTWIYRLENGIVLRQEIFMPHECASVALRWSVIEQPAGVSPDSVHLHVRPFLSPRDYHGLQLGAGGYPLEATLDGQRVTWRFYSGLPSVRATTNASYQNYPLWYRNFLYLEELERGLDCSEDLFTPGIFQWKFGRFEAILMLDAMHIPGERAPCALPPSEQFQQLMTAELQRRKQLGNQLERAADQYIVRRFPANYSHPRETITDSNGNSNFRDIGQTIVAGYPWFTDWGRDTFIALRGLCIASGRLDVAQRILLEWSTVVSQGMLPNRFPDQGDAPEYNSVDASLWFVVAAYEFLQVAESSQFQLTDKDRRLIVEAIEKIVEGYAQGTRFGIRADDDGLLFAGQPGVQLTWMDAKVGDWVVTPRIGKPVEIQALWLNALWIVEQLESTALNKAPNLNPSTLLQRGCDSFRNRFWNAKGGYLFDVVDVDFESGKCDSSFRPNQIFAVGGLPFSILDQDQGRQIVDAVESRLLTPLGLRSLDREHPDYKPIYRGGVWQRDGAYHQGTIWPWLIGPFVEAWVRVRGNSAPARDAAEQRFIRPLRLQLDQFGLGHISEIADADAPHIGRGCPFQAWSLGELIRLQKTVLNPAFIRAELTAPVTLPTA